MTDWISHPNAKALVRADDNDPYSVAPPEAGRDLDALVATKVMGWANVGMKEMYSMAGGDFGEPSTLEPDGEALRGNPPNAPDYAREQTVPGFSSQIAAAWLVVEKLRSQGWCFEIFTEHEESYVAHFYRPGSRAPLRSDVSAATAICKAALDVPRASGSSDRE